MNGLVQHRQLIRMKHALVTLLLLGLLGSLAYLSTRYTLQTDITHNASNTLSAASQKLLAALPDKVTVTAYIKQGQPLRMQIAQLLDRYNRHKEELSLTFVDPDLEPEKARELNIGPEGVLLVTYQGRTEKLSFIDESSLTNALFQLANANEQWVTFLSGHGERSPETSANFDLSQFGKELEHRKIKAQTLNLATLPAIPDNSALLVIASPAVPLLAGEIALIKRYIDAGGNLLLLSDPGNQNLAVLLQPLGISQLPGTLIDNSSKLYGIDDAGFVLASSYPQHPITQGLLTITLYPFVAALKATQSTAFKVEALLSGSAQAWVEIGESRSTTHSHPQQSPPVFAYALTRTRPNNRQQRIVTVGDGDFLANAYLGNVGNLDMGLRMVAWLTHEDRFIEIPAKMASDKALQLTKASVAVIGLGFLLIVPLALIGTGFFIWHKRKRR